MLYAAGALYLRRLLRGAAAQAPPHRAARRRSSRRDAAPALWLYGQRALLLIEGSFAA
jgi:hypothetical protein